MSYTFNLNIQDYTLIELKDLLNIVEPYTLEDIVNNENELREKLIMDDDVSKEKKGDIIKFLESAKNTLIADYKKKFEEVTKEKPEALKTVNIINSVRRDQIAEKGENINTIYKLISLDSRFRDNYDNTKSTDFIMDLPTNIKNVISIELSSIEIPSTYYQISHSFGNNYFWFQYADPSATDINDLSLNTYYVEIPDGNYSRQKIQDTINREILSIVRNYNTDGKSPGSWPVRACPIINIDENSGKSWLYVESNPDDDHATENAYKTNTKFNVFFNKKSYSTKVCENIVLKGSRKLESDDPMFDIADEKHNLDYASDIISSIGWTLGYRGKHYLFEGENIVENTVRYISTGCYDAHGPKYLYVIVNDFNKNFNNFCVPTYNSSLGSSNVIARISTDSFSSSKFSTGQIVQKNNLRDNYTFRKRKYFGPVNISRLQIQIVDEFGRIVDLNSMDFSMALNVVCLYD